MYNNYGYSKPSGGGGGTVLILLLLMMLSSVLALGYVGYKKSLDEDPPEFSNSTVTPIYSFGVVDEQPVFTLIEPSDCSGETYVKKKTCSRNGVILDGSAGKCGQGTEEWVLDPNAPGYHSALGTGSCPVQNRDCDVPCDEPCKGQTWIEGACIRNGVVLDGSETDKCGRGMRTYTLDENAPDYAASIGRGTCTKTYSSACDIECPQNAVAPPSCVYSSTWQKSANGCVVSKEDNAAVVGYDQVGWQEKFKLALEAENCTGEKRLSEWETCQGPPAPVDCVGTFTSSDNTDPNGWGMCIGSCGTQPTRQRKYQITTVSKNGGASCPYIEGHTERENCGSVTPCCVAGNWVDDETAPCDSSGWKGQKRTNTEHASGACDSLDTTRFIRCCYQGNNWTAVGSCHQYQTNKQKYTQTVAGDCPTGTDTKYDDCKDCEGYWSNPECPSACGYLGGDIANDWVKTVDPIGTGACPTSTPKSCPATVACSSDCRGQWNRTNECRTRHYDGRAGMSRHLKEYKYIYGITHTKIGTGADCPNNTGDVKWQGNIVAYANRNC